MRKFLLVAGLAALLSGCDEKGDFEKAINAKISQSKLCYSLQDNDIVFNKGFPIRVNHGYRSAGYSASDEILKGLANQGLLDVSQQANGFSSVDVLEVTDKGQEGNDSNLLIVFYVQIMPDDFVMQLHRF